MNSLVILSKLEEEYLIRACESAIYVHKLRQFFLWTQGQLQGLLPHQVLVSVYFGPNDEVQAIECIDRQARGAALVKALCQPEHGLAIRIARHCRAGNALPCVIEARPDDGEHPMSLFQQELARTGLGSAIAHGTERLPGGATFFALFTLSEAPTERHVFFLELLLPHLHLAFQRVLAAGETPVTQKDAMDGLSAREIEILTWVMRGKSNFEIGAILHLSALTVKNHLQKIYRKLNVHNRVQAVSRCWDLQSHQAGRPDA